MQVTTGTKPPATAQDRAAACTKSVVRGRWPLIPLDSLQMSNRWHVFAPPLDQDAVDLWPHLRQSR
jgi:hypothetical protein